MSSQDLRYPNAAAVTVAAIGPNGAPIPSQSILVAGENTSGNLQPLSTDNSGNLNVNVVSLTPISGTVTANQGTANTLSNAWPVKLTDGTNTNSFTANGLKVDGSAVTQPISAISLPLPTGASTSALQTQISGQLPSSLGQKVSASSLAVTIASDQSAIPVSPGSSVGYTQANTPVYNIYGSSPITTSSYVQLVASTSNTINYIDIFDSSGQAMILATGGSGSEIILAYIPPGGDQIKVNIPASTRIAYKALTANASAGYLLFNMYK